MSDSSAPLRCWSIFAVLISLALCFGCRTSGLASPSSPASASGTLGSLQDTSATPEATMRLPEGSIKLSPLTAAASSIISTATKGGSSLHLVFTLVGCHDRLGPVLHHLSRSPDGKVEVFVYALNIHTRASESARCAAPPTADHDIWLGQRPRAMTDLTLHLLNTMAATDNPTTDLNSRSVPLDEFASALKVTLGRVNAVAVSSARCAAGATCPPPAANVETFYMMNCLSQIGPVLYHAKVNPRPNGEVKIYAGATEIIDQRGARAFCLAPAIATTSMRVEAVNPDLKKDDVAIANLTPSRSADEPVQPAMSLTDGTVVSPDPDAGFVSCMAFWTGVYFDESTNQCHQGGRSGCTSPYPFKTLEECQRRKVVPPPRRDRPVSNCLAYFSGYSYNSALKTCEFGTQSGCVNPFAYPTFEACTSAHSEALAFSRSSSGTSCRGYFEGFYRDKASKKCVAATFAGCTSPFPYKSLDDCQRP